MEQFDSWRTEDTCALGLRMGKEAAAGTVYCLNGDLGVGKTVFAQGFAKGLGIPEIICSPTFTILQTYENGRIPFYHYDVYRISDISEMEEIGYEEFFNGEGVCLIEWGSLIRDILPRNSVIITIEKDLNKGFDYRRICIDKMS